MNSKNISVAVLMGGDSSERSVSFSSGRAVADALQSAGFAVSCFDVSSQGYRGDASRADAMGRKPRHAIFPLEWDHLVTALQTNGFDCVFPTLHGGRGEDGTLQTLLQVAGLAYVGSPARSCAIAIDKPLAKAYLRSDFDVVSPRGVFLTAVEELDEAKITFPCVVKPAGGGSSVGVSILHEKNEEALRRALVASLSDGSGALIEEFVDGIELTCAVVGEGETARALPVIEIVPQKGGGFYDFEAKYAAGGSEHLVPANIEDAARDRVQELALRVHRALGCRGVARSDFLLDKTSGEVYFLECNTSPGMTETSLVPDAARAAGLSFSELLEELIDTARGLV